MNIIMIAATLPPLPSGGAELQALKLGEELSKKGVTVSFLTPGKGKIKGNSLINGMPVSYLSSIFNALFDSLSRLKKKRNIPTTRIDYDDNKEVTDQLTRKVGLATIIYYNIFFFHSLFFLWRRRKDIDIIHSHTMEWSAIVAERLGRWLNKPVIIKDSTMNGFQSLARFPSGIRHQRTLAKGAHFIAMTEMIFQNLIKAGISPNKITKIPNGIVTEGTFEVPAGTKNALSVLFVGNLTQQPAKGLDILLRAWITVQASFPGASLQIIGDGVTDRYLQYVRELGIAESVQFLGKRMELIEYYRKTSVFVLPSRREGMSNALMEAMLYAIPCVATNISGSQDLIQDQVNGILVPPADLKSLSAGIVYLLANTREAESMGQKARETIVGEFDIRNIAGKYILLYKKLLSGES